MYRIVLDGCTAMKLETYIVRENARPQVHDNTRPRTARDRALAHTPPHTVAMTVASRLAYNTVGLGGTGWTLWATYTLQSYATSHIRYRLK
jgi:hypothetical protein